MMQSRCCYHGTSRQSYWPCCRCRLGSGAFVSGKLSEFKKRPKEPIILYEFDACPFCRKVWSLTWSSWLPLSNGRPQCLNADHAFALRSCSGSESSLII